MSQQKKTVPDILRRVALKLFGDPKEQKGIGKILMEFLKNGAGKPPFLFVPFSSTPSADHSVPPKIPSINPDSILIKKSHSIL